MHQNYSELMKDCLIPLGAWGGRLDCLHDAVKRHGKGLDCYICEFRRQEYPTILILIYWDLLVGGNGNVRAQVLVDGMS